MLKPTPEGNDNKYLKEKLSVLKLEAFDKRSLIWFDFKEPFNHLPLSAFYLFFYDLLKRRGPPQTTSFF
tara:strand:+ start:295 stop:501 length:207 start_codon:yes stop_codon:yes gene_type:complete